MPRKQVIALADLLRALEQAHRVGLLDELREECLDARSVDDMCEAAREWAIDLGIKEV